MTIPLIGSETGSTGRVTLEGGLWDNTTDLRVGFEGSGTLDVEGATVESLRSYLGHEPGSTGIANIDKDGLWDNGSYIHVGREGNGTLNINGGTVQDTLGIVGSYAGSTGTVTVNSGLWDNNQGLYIGFSGGDGALNIYGGTVQNGRGFIGNLAASTGVVTITEGLWDNAFELYVGREGNGTLNFEGGTVQSAVGYIGHATGSTGSVTADSGQWNMTGDLSVGYDGSGTLLISSGTVRNNGGRIGYFSGTGTVTITHGLWDNSSNLSIGDAGTGTLNINRGTVQNNYCFIGYYAGSTGTVTVAGGLWNHNNDLRVARAGNGTLNIHGGHVTVGSNFIFEHQPSGTSVLNFSLTTPPPPSVGFIEVAGNAQLAGELHVTLASGSTLVQGDYFTLIDLTDPLATVTGAFSNFAEGDVLTTDTNGVVLRLSYQGGDGNDIVAHTCFALEPTNGPYGEWAITNGLVGCVNDAPSDDPDADGMSNLQEYATGGNPLVDDAATMLPVFATNEEGDTNYLYLIYTRRLDAEERGLIYRVCSTTDLVLVPLTNVTEEVGSMVIDANFELVTNRISMEVEPFQVMALKVQLTK